MNIEKRIVKEKISIDEDLVLCVNNIVFEQDLKCKNISSKNLNKSFKVKGNIDAGNINAGNINAWNINAWDIDAGDIDAGNIDAENIDAENINALYISYFASCVSRKTFKCVSIKGRRDKSIHVCLDNEIEFKTKKVRLEDLSKQELISELKEEQNNSNEKQLGAIKELEKALVLSKALNDKNIESYLKNRIIELKEGASIK